MAKSTNLIKEEVNIPIVKDSQETLSQINGEKLSQEAPKSPKPKKVKVPNEKANLNNPNYIKKLQRLNEKKAEGNKVQSKEQKNEKNDGFSIKEGTPSKSRKMSKEKHSGKVEKLQIVPLGGVGEIGKNMTCISYGDKMIIVDAGMTMPGEDQLGIDTVIPDIAYLRENAHKLIGIFITHGHEDHIGALPYIIDDLDVPIYSTRLTIGLILRKFTEVNLEKKPRTHVVNPRSEIKVGPFRIEFIRMSHSIPDAVALAIHTPAGVIVHTGDFKIDFTPVDGQNTDFYKLASLGEQGVLALLSDSTNAEKPGFSQSETMVGENVERIFENAEGRIIIASFASNVYRIQEIINSARRVGRKVAVMGRSMINMVEVAQNLGYLKLGKDQLVTIDQLLKLPRNKAVIISTGSQGEPLSALSRIATKGHRKIEIFNDDTVVISAMAIPGNEKNVSFIIDHLMQLGAKVVYGRDKGIHVSGHASQEELKLMISLIKPKYFIPVHGEYRMLMKNKELAIGTGIPEDNVVIIENGSVVEVSEERCAIVDKVYAGAVLVDGLGVGDVSNIVLRDRKILSENGMIIVVVGIDKQGSVIVGPDIVSRGFVYVRESEELMDEIKEKTKDIIKRLRKENVRSWASIKTRLREDLDTFIYEKTRRSPMVIAIISEVK